MRSITLSFFFAFIFMNASICLAAPERPAHHLTMTYVFDSDAVIIPEVESRPGSTNQIRIDGKEMLIDPIGSAKETFETLIGNLQRYGQEESRAGTAIGFIVKEKGHMPNPTKEFDVFKALMLNFALLR